MGPGMFDDIPKVLAAFAVLIAVVALAVGFAVGRL